MFWATDLGASPLSYNRFAFCTIALEQIPEVITTFDRYLIRRFFYIFSISFLTAFGLFVVIDAFTNVDGFQGHNAGSGFGVLFLKMGEYYVYQSAVFFDLVSPILTVVSVMIVFAMLQRNSEVHPILSAGVPTYRLAVPLLLSAFAINLLHTLNQEIVIPAIADHLQAPRGTDESTAQSVEPVCDYATRVAIYGDQLYLNRQMIRNASFVLPVPELTHDLTTLRASEAVYQPRTASHPSGWLLKGVRPQAEQLKLTERGRKIVLPGAASNEVFVVSDVSFDQLHERNASFHFLPTSELMRRINRPALGLASLRSLSLHFHERLTGPFLNLIAVLMTVPLIIRRGSDSLITNLAICTAVLGSIFVLLQTSLYLGKMNLISVELAAWLPIIISGSVCAWIAGSVQT